MPEHVKFNSITSFQSEPSHTMEGIGLTLALVPLFNAAIGCFTLVKMAKKFDSDLQLFTVRLEVLHLRLTRWGEAAGLNKVSKDNEAPTTNLRESDVTLDKKALEQINARFDDAAKVVQGIDMGEDVAASTADLGDKKTLIERMRAMSIKRHPRTSAMSKAKWVVYQKDELSSLTKDLSNSLNDLDHVLPTGSASLTPICDEEVSQIFSNERPHQASIKMLEDVATELDENLADAIARHQTNVSASARQNSSHNMLTICMTDILQSPDHIQHQQWCQ